MMNEAKKTNRINELDFIRTLAMISVFTAHFYGSVPFYTKDSYSSSFFLVDGVYAVTVFFMLSGFVMALSGFRRKAPSLKAVGSKIWKRYVSFTLPVLIVTFFGWLIVNARDGAGYSFLSYLYEGFFGTLFLGKTTFLAPLWTMKYEWFASICIYLLLFFIFGKNVWVRLASYALLGIVAVLVDPVYGCFLAGLVLADFYIHVQQEGMRKFALSKGGVIAAVLLLLLGLLLAGYPGFSEDTFWNAFLPYSRLNRQLFHVAASALLIESMLLFHMHVDGKECKTGIFGFISGISFEMYLIHALWIENVSLPFKELVERVSGSAGFGILVSYLLMLLATVACAYILKKLTGWLQSKIFQRN